MVVQNLFLLGVESKFDFLSNRTLPSLKCSLVLILIWPELLLIFTMFLASSCDHLHVHTVIVLGHTHRGTRNAQLFTEARYARLPTEFLRHYPGGTNPESVQPRRRWSRQWSTVDTESLDSMLLWGINCFLLLLALGKEVVMDIVKMAGVDSGSLIGKGYRGNEMRNTCVVYYGLYRDWDTYLIQSYLHLQITALALYFASFLVHVGAIRGARVLHNDLLAGIMRAPQLFFDTSPLGRIISRFSGDVDTLDSRMASFIRSALITSHRVINVLAIDTEWLRAILSLASYVSIL